MKILICTSLGILGAIANAQTYGNTSSFETQSGHSQDFILGVQVSVTSTITLDSFGLMYGQTGSTPTTANGKFALYSSSAASGLPMNLIASTGAMSLSGIGTINNIAFTSSPTIAPGTYWMMALYQTFATPRMGVAGANSTSLVSYWSQSYATGFDATAPAITTYNGQNFNYWINGHAPVPEPASFAALGLGVLAFAVRRRRSN